MRAVSADFIEAVRSDNRQISSSLVFQNGEIVADELESYKIETVASPFNVSMKKITAKILSTEIDFLNKVVVPKIAINNHQISLEPFEITEVKTNLENGITEISGFDAMVKTHKAYQKTLHNFPCSMNEFISQIANSCELELVDDFEISNSNLEIPIDYFEKIHQISYRDILRQIAEITGGIFLARNGKLAFSKIKNNQIAATLADFDLKKLSLGEKTKPINSLVLSRSPQEDNIYFRRENFNFENLSELKIVNNEIVDKRRSEVAERIFEAVEGVRWQGFTAETFGFGFLEAGDKVRIQAGGSDFESFIFNSTLNVSQSLSESFKTTVLTPAITNYKRASDIFQKIHNTEIVVDKQNQKIESIISERIEKDGEVAENFSRLNQSLDNFKYQIQRANGLNLIKNSAFFSLDKDKNPNFWQITGNLAFESSPEAQTFGAISGRKIQISRGKISQKVTVVAFRGDEHEEDREHYSLSFLVKKPLIGEFSVKIRQGEQVLRSFEIPANTDAVWQNVKLEGILPTSNEITVEFEHRDAVNDSSVEIADIMLANNKTAQNWTMAQGEIANTQVAIDEKGIVVNSSINEGDYTAITPLEFSGYSKTGDRVERVFTLNKDTTEVKKLKAEDELNMAPIKIVAIKTGDTQGWAFVANEERR